MQSERLRLLAGASVLFILGLCALLALVQDGGGENRTELDGIDSYLADKYGGGGGGMQSFHSLQAAVSGHHSGDLPMQMSMFEHHHQAHRQALQDSSILSRQAHRRHTVHAHAHGRGRTLEMEVGGYPRELGMSTSRPSAGTRDLRGGDSFTASEAGTMSSLTHEEKLDAEANSFDIDDRKPCAGKPCFAVIDDPHFRGHHS